MRPVRSVEATESVGHASLARLALSSRFAGLVSRFYLRTLPHLQLSFFILCRGSPVLGVFDSRGSFRGGSKVQCDIHVRPLSNFYFLISSCIFGFPRARAMDAQQQATDNQT